VRTPFGVLLIDAGLGPLSAGRRMEGSGIHVREISAICLTHLDHDHFAPTWVEDAAAAANSGLFAMRRASMNCWSALIIILWRATSLGSFRHSMDIRSKRCHESSCIRSNSPTTGRGRMVCDRRFWLPHWLCDGPGTCAGGAVAMLYEPRHLALESNYDPRMQMQSARPWFLKNRIMGGAGHLSNSAGVRGDCANSQPHGKAEWTAAAATSCCCIAAWNANCPKLVRKFFGRDVRIARGSHWPSNLSGPAGCEPCDAQSVWQQLSLAWG